MLVTLGGQSAQPLATEQQRKYHDQDYIQNPVSLSLSDSEERGEGEEWKPSSSLCHYVIITEINAQKSTTVIDQQMIKHKAMETKS